MRKGDKEHIYGAKTATQNTKRIDNMSGAYKKQNVARYLRKVESMDGVAEGVFLSWYFSRPKFDHIHMHISSFLGQHSIYITYLRTLLFICFIFTQIFSANN